MAKKTYLIHDFTSKRFVYDVKKPGPKPEPKTEKLTIKEPTIEELDTGGIKIDPTKPFEGVEKVVNGNVARNKNRIDQFRARAAKLAIKPEEKAQLNRRADILMAKVEGAAQQALKSLQAKYAEKRKALIDKKVTTLRKGLDALGKEGAKVAAERARIKAEMGSDLGAFVESPKGKEWLTKNRGSLQKAMLDRSARLYEKGNVIEKAAHKHAEFIEDLIDDDYEFGGTVKGAVGGATIGGVGGLWLGHGLVSAITTPVGAVGGGILGGVGGLISDVAGDKRRFDDIVESYDENIGLDYDEDTTAGFAQGLAYAVSAEGGKQAAAALIQGFLGYEQKGAKDDGNMEKDDFVNAAKIAFSGFDVRKADKFVFEAMKKAFSRSDLVKENTFGNHDVKAANVTRAEGYLVACLAMGSERFKEKPELKAQYDKYVYASVANMGKEGRRVWEVKKFVMTPKMWMDGMIQETPKLEDQTPEEKEALAKNKEVLLKKNGEFMKKQGDRVKQYADLVLKMQKELGIKKTIPELKPVADLIAGLPNIKTTVIDTTKGPVSQSIAQVKIEQKLIESVDIAASKQGQEIVKMLDGVRDSGNQLATEALAGKKNEVMAKMADNPTLKTIAAMMANSKHPSFAKMQGPEHAATRMFYKEVVQLLKEWSQKQPVNFDDPATLTAAIDQINKTGKYITERATALAFLNQPEKPVEQPGSAIVKVDDDMKIGKDGKIKFTSKRALAKITLGSRSNAPALMVDGKLVARGRRGEYYPIVRGKLSNRRVKIYNGTEVKPASAQQIADAKAALGKGYRGAPKKRRPDAVHEPYYVKAPKKAAAPAAPRAPRATEIAKRIPKALPASFAKTEASIKSWPDGAKKTEAIRKLNAAKARWIKRNSKG